MRVRTCTADANQSSISSNHTYCAPGMLTSVMAVSVKVSSSTPETCCTPEDAGEGDAAPGELGTGRLLVDDKTMAAMAKALGHPTRVRILRILIERRACITGELVAELPLAQSTISEHLRILREAGLIQGEIEGPRTSYCVSRVGLAALKRAIASL